MSIPEKKAAKKNPVPSRAAPHVITPGEHPITRAMLDADALLVLRKLHDAGFSAYLVGGGVRDLYTNF